MADGTGIDPGSSSLRVLIITMYVSDLVARGAWWLVEKTETQHACEFMMRRCNGTCASQRLGGRLETCLLVDVVMHGRALDTWAADVHLRDDARHSCDVGLVDNKSVRLGQTHLGRRGSTPPAGASSGGARGPPGLIALTLLHRPLLSPTALLPIAALCLSVPRGTSRDGGRAFTL